MSTRYQQGSVWLDRRRRVWYFRWRADGVRKSKRIGTFQEYPTKTQATKACAGIRLVANQESEVVTITTVRGIVQRYMAEAMPERFSTRKAYTAYLKNHVLPMWGEHNINDLLDAEQVERWLNTVKLAGKSKANLKGILFLTVEHAMKWKYIPVQRNPMQLVRIKGGIQRLEEPRVLTLDEFQTLLAHLDEPFKTMALAAGCLGLRCSELFALKWSDFDFQRMTLKVERGIVAGRVDDVKTRHSRKLLPLDSRLAAAILRWRSATEFSNDDNWVWASPAQGGEMPYLSWGVQQRQLKPAAIRAGLGEIGWHALRHSYRSWLDDTGAPMSVQQELMRHSDIRTTMNVYGGALSDSKREANSKIVRMVLRGRKKSGLQQSKTSR